MANGNGRPKSRKRLVLISLGVVVLAVLGLMAARRNGTQIDPSRLAAIEQGDLARSVVATGKVQPLTKVEIKSKASGIVERLYVDYGDRVKAGQVLAELDREQLEAAVREARANLLAAEAAWERNKIAAAGPDLPFLRSALRRVLRGSHLRLWHRDQHDLPWRGRRLHRPGSRRLARPVPGQRPRVSRSGADQDRGRLPPAQRVVYRNLGNGRFEDISERMGPPVTTPRAGRGAAFGDLDNDGDIDVVVNNVNEAPDLFRLDRTGPGHWLMVKLVGTVSNRNALGARIGVRIGGRTLYEEVRGGGSYYAQNDFPVHFGLPRRGQMPTVWIPRTCAFDIVAEKTFVKEKRSNLLSYQH